jgi:hypothetical protein
VIHFGQNAITLSVQALHATKHCVAAMAAQVCERTRAAVLCALRTMLNDLMLSASF